jgi:hypothetical protein
MYILNDKVYENVYQIVRTSVPLLTSLPWISFQNAGNLIYIFHQKKKLKVALSKPWHPLETKEKRYQGNN